jgi:hypothetical protein
MLKNIDPAQMELTDQDREEAAEAGEQAYMRAITEFGKPFNHEDMTRCIEFFLDAARNTKFIAHHS